MNVAVIGAGPSGMMAAHAVSQMGHIVTIFDKDPEQSRRNSGVFYLHDDCDLKLDAVEFKQAIFGAKRATPEEIRRSYSLRVYTKEIENVSIGKIYGKESGIAFNAEQAMGRLWDLYGDLVRNKTITFLADILLLRENYDKVITTIPLPILYPKGHFESFQTYIRVGTAPKNEAFIFYSISSNHKWYRCSALFGIFTMEYAYGQKPSEKEGYSIKQVTKVISTDIIPSEENVFFTGRYGAWDKSCLTHDVYYRTMDWLNG